MNVPVQLILDDAHPGVWNMAVDEALLEESLATGQIFLRIYRWSEATVSLGYFQNEADRDRDPRLCGLPIVRRLSGGGAILHHHEQTYSCVIPPTHQLAQTPYQLYEQIHSTVRDWLRQQGISALFRNSASDAHEDQFLCFRREAAADLVVNGHKILGSAQRRRRGAVLQHGSLLLKRSEHLPEILGVNDLVPAAHLSWESFPDLAMSLGNALGSQVEPVPPPETVRSRVQVRLAQLDSTVRSAT
jgi:lipoate-protein ligase A